MQFQITDIPGALEIRDGLPRPNWDAIADWVNQSVPEDGHNEAWTHLAREWLAQLRQRLAGDYAVTEASHFLLLSATSEEANEQLLRHCGHYHQVILDSLVGLGQDEGFGKHIILLFRDSEAFYTYVCDFYPDAGEFADAAGVFLDRGYGHVAINGQFAIDLERTIVHELVHAMLRHLPLPLWVNEGVTQVVEDHAIGSSSFWMDGDLARQHRAYWNADSIDAFWSGESFYFPDDGQMLSYSLAEVLVRNLSADYPAQTIEFVKQAHFNDAGADALTRTCGVQLSALVTQFLGPGEWQPRNDYWNLEQDL